MSDSDEDIPSARNNNKKLIESDDDCSSTKDKTININDKVSNENDAQLYKNESNHNGNSGSSDDQISNSENNNSDDSPLKAKFKKYRFLDDDEDTSNHGDMTDNLGINVNSNLNNLELNTSNVQCNLSENKESYDKLPVEKKVKKYKLLSEDDISDAEDEKNNTKNESISISKLYNDKDTSLSENSNLSGSNSSDGLERKKQLRKNKLQKLNRQRKREIRDKECLRSQSCSDSESENDGTRFSIENKASRKKKKDIVKLSEHCSKSSRSSSDSCSEHETNATKSSNTKLMKCQKKSKVHPKSNKIDPMLEIRSKTQKIIRESRISLPYHQPKRRSLNEFLQRKKNAPSLPLKPSNDLLNLVSERLSKQEEEVADFYKSESEDSSSENINNASSVNELSHSQIRSDINIDSANVQEKSNLETLFETIENINLLEETDLSKNVDFSSKDIGDINAKYVEPVNSVSHESAASHNSEANSITKDVIILDSVMKSEENCVLPEQNTATKDVIILDSVMESEENCVLPEQNTAPNCKSIERMQVDQNKITLSEETVIDNEMTMKSREIESSENTENINVPSECDVILQDSNDFELQITDSCTAEHEQDSAKNISVEKKIDVRNKKLALLAELKVPVQESVKINAEPNSVLQFDVKLQPKTGVVELMKKFAYHTSVKSKPQKRNTSKLSVIVAEKNCEGEIIGAVKETFELTAEQEIQDEFSGDKFTRPGSKYAYFKDKMKQTLISKKQANWEEYQNKKEKLYASDLSDDESDEEQLGSKPDFEPYHPEDELDDEDLVLDDIELKDKKRKKNVFLDEEAEVSYDEEENLKESDEDEFENEDSDRSSNSNNVESEEEGEPNAEASDIEDALIETEKNDQIAKENQDTNLDSNLLNINENTSNDFKKPAKSSFLQLFKYNTTGNDLENKVLGLESILTQKLDNASEFTNSQIFDLCSGEFPSQLEKPTAMSQGDSQFCMDSPSIEDSQSINLSLQDINDEFCGSGPNISVINCNSLLLSDESDTEELFAKKKKSARIEDSDEEDDNAAEIATEMKENDDDPAVQTATEIKENKDDESDNSDDAEEVDTDVDEDSADEFPDEIGYNSEEEIINLKENMTKQFFENEAELSESEWGSEDEVENGLDELEKEAGDEDDIDQEKLKEELGKIHMRQMLDDDQNDVRMLQEILLEDGELHSDGKRERKFKWKNVDDNFFTKTSNDSDDDQANDENAEERDESWRKIRYEREMYISQQEKNLNLVEDLKDDDNISIPLAKNVTAITTTEVNHDKSPNFRYSLNTRFKCGSFLSRSKSILNRIAVTVGECKQNVNRVKNHRNFVFANISPEKELPDVPVEKTEKRKISNKSVVASKKLKLSTDANVPIIKRGLLAQLAAAD